MLKPLLLGLILLPALELLEISAGLIVSICCRCGRWQSVRLRRTLIALKVNASTVVFGIVSDEVAIPFVKVLGS